MREQNILEAARARVSQLQAEARAALLKKQSLERLARAEKERRETSSVLTGRLTKSGRTDWAASAVGEAAKVLHNLGGGMTESTRLWLKKNAPEKLPPEPTEPELTIEQQAKQAHNDYVDLCYRLSAAKVEVVNLEKKINEAAAILRCVQEAA